MLEQENMLLPRLLSSLLWREARPRNSVAADHDPLGFKVAAIDPLHGHLWVSVGLLKEVVQGFEAVVAVNNDRSICGAKDQKWL